MQALGVRAHRAALGAVNKRAYAAKAGVSLERLLHDRAFKEQHRVSPAICSPTEPALPQSQQLEPRVATDSVSRGD